MIQPLKYSYIGLMGFFIKFYKGPQAKIHKLQMSRPTRRLPKMSERQKHVWIWNSQNDVYCFWYMWSNPKFQTQSMLRMHCKSRNFNNFIFASGKSRGKWVWKNLLDTWITYYNSELQSLNGKIRKKCMVKCCSE